MALLSQDEALLSLLLPLRGASVSLLGNPGCRFASLACPGLGAHCPFGALVGRVIWTRDLDAWLERVV